MTWRKTNITFKPNQTIYFQIS